MSDRKVIEDFPDYEISNQGEVYNIKTGNERKASVGPNGSLKVTLFRDMHPYTRSVALLVAKEHLWNDWDPEIYNTPIHLNNDLKDCRVENLAWRPRWFAIHYNKQYWKTNYRFSTVKVIDRDTDEFYPSIMDVCQRYGVLFADVITSCNNEQSVFPTTKSFRFA